MFKENITYLVKRTSFTPLSSRFPPYLGWVLGSVSTIKAAVELKKTFDQIAAAEKSGSLSVEEKRKLEESVAEKVGGDVAWFFVMFCVTCLRRSLILLVFCFRFLGHSDIIHGTHTHHPLTSSHDTLLTQTSPPLLKGAKLEIESVLRETCERVLSPDPSPAQGQGQGKGQGPSNHTGAAHVSREKLHMRAVALQIMGEVCLTLSFYLYRFFFHLLSTLLLLSVPRIRLLTRLITGIHGRTQRDRTAGGRPGVYQCGG